MIASVNAIMDFGLLFFLILFGPKGEDYPTGLADKACSCAAEALLEFSCHLPPNGRVKT
jgi:hypothetical protein